MKCSWSCPIDSIPPNCPPCPHSTALHHVARLGASLDPKQTASPLFPLPLCELSLPCSGCLLELRIPASMLLCAPCSVYISTHVRAACVCAAPLILQAPHGQVLCFIHLRIRERTVPDIFRCSNHTRQRREEGDLAPR